jgi:general secretion pathway protein G
MAGWRVKTLWGRLPTCGRLAIGFRESGGNQPPSGIPSCSTVRGSRSGMTLVELIVAFTILLVLTSMAVPVARTNVRRIKERNLREALKEVRTAIDKYKDMADAGKLGIQKQDTYGYPETLQALVDGVKGSGQAADTKLKFLRRIPLDPMTNTRDWGLRSMQDDPTSTSWGGQNVFDVYTKSMDKAADGTPYSEW